MSQAVLTLDFRSDAELRPRSGRQVHVWTDERHRVRARGFCEAGRRWIDWEGVGTFAFDAGSPSVRVWPDAGAPPDLIDDVFGRSLTPVILQALGLQAIHAAAAGVDDQVVALCGRSGSGKSTFGFALGQRPGFHQHADDAVVFEVGDSAVTTPGTPFLPRLRPASRAHFSTARQVRGPIPARGVLRALVVLEPAPGGALAGRLTLATQTAAFASVLAHAHCFDLSSPAEVARLSADYLRLVSLVPVYRLSYTPDLQRLGSLVDLVVTRLEESGCLAVGAGAR